jgi:S-adenosylmethionine:tRNA ribosyltransferase-isomerase
MSTLAFELLPALEASEPPEARGLGRDEVRLMVASRAGETIVHARFHDLADHLEPGDLIVINASSTLPAAVPATRADGTGVELRFSTRAPGVERSDRFVVELRTAGGAAPLADGGAGEELRLPAHARVRLLAPYAGRGRLWLAATAGVGELHQYLTEHGHPIRYGHVPRPWPLSAYQTVYGTVPGSAEMPSAGRPFTAELITGLVALGVQIAPVTLHAGVSSPEAHEPPYPEQYAVPAATARLVNHLRAAGQRVIAIGTTVVRALESAVGADGRLEPGSGWTNLVISRDRPPRAVDGLLTGWHEPRASHLRMLEAIGGEQLLARSYEAALATGYLWHEFGDSHLILP